MTFLREPVGQIYEPAFSAEHVGRLYKSINNYTRVPHLSEVSEEELIDADSDLVSEVLGIVALYAVKHGRPSTRDYQVNRLLAYLENDTVHLEKRYHLPVSRRSNFKNEIAIKVAGELDKLAGLRS